MSRARGTVPSPTRATSTTKVVTDTDVFRLQRCVASARGVLRTFAVKLQEELAQADVVRSSQISPAVVTMNSRVALEDTLTTLRRVITLVYPEQADPRAGRVSVFAPLGTALLGRSIGETVESTVATGRVAHLRVVAVEYQPEAAGDLHL